MNISMQHKAFYSVRVHSEANIVTVVTIFLHISLLLVVEEYGVNIMYVN